MEKNHQLLCEKDVKKNNENIIGELLCNHHEWGNQFLHWLSKHIKWYKLVEEGIKEEESFSFTVHFNKGKIAKMTVLR